MSDELKLDPLNRPVVGKEVRDLAKEIRADEQAAHVRDGIEGREKFSGVMEAAPLPPTDYERQLTEAARRGPNHTEDKNHER